MSPNRSQEGSGGIGGQRVTGAQAALWVLAFAIVLALVILYFLYGSAARPLLGAATDLGSASAWLLS